MYSTSLLPNDVITRHNHNSSQHHFLKKYGEHFSVFIIMFPWLLLDIDAEHGQSMALRTWWSGGEGFNSFLPLAQKGSAGLVGKWERLWDCQGDIKGF